MAKTCNKHTPEAPSEAPLQAPFKLSKQRKNVKTICIKSLDKAINGARGPLVY
jgi:hypothetical protein